MYEKIEEKDSDTDALEQASKTFSKQRRSRIEAGRNGANT